MSKREERLIKLKRAAYFVGMHVFAIMCIATLLLEWFVLTGVFFVLVFVFIYLFAYSYNIKYNHKKHKAIRAEIAKAVYKNPVPVSKVIQDRKYYGLDRIEKPIIKLFYNINNTERFYIIKESNAVKAFHEKLELYDDEEKVERLSFANWTITDYLANNYYEDAEIALKENSSIVNNLKEEDIAITTNKLFFAEVSWVGLHVGSKELPFGNKIAFDMVLKGSKIENVVLENTRWYETNYSTVKITYPTNTSISINLNKSFKFKLMLNNKVVGNGKFYINKSQF